MVRPTGTTKYTEEFLLEELKRYYNEFGEIPTQRKLDQNKNYPGYTVYRKRFGSIENALHMIGLQSFRENQKIIHNNIKNDYDNGLLLNDIALKYKLDKNYIIAILNKFGIKLRTDIWDNEDFLYLKDNLNKLSNIEIAFNLNKSLCNVIYKCNNNRLVNKSIYYFPQYICNDKESYLYNIIINRLNCNELIDITSMGNITGIKDLSIYCRNLYGLSYENFLLTFFNINYNIYLRNNCIKLYDLLFKNKKKQFPSSFWELDTITKLGRHVFNDILKWEDNDFYNKYSSDVLNKYGLIYGIRKLNMNIFDYLSILFPNLNTTPFLFKNAPVNNGYWDKKENKFKALDYIINSLIEDNIISNIKDLPKKLSSTLLKKRFYSLLRNTNIIDLINEYTYEKYNIRFNEWEFNCVPNYFWHENNNIKNAIKWMLEDKENWDGKDINWLIDNYSAKMFRKHNISGLLSSSNSDISLINLLYIAYPNIDVFPWEFHLVSRNYWNKERAKEVLKQLVENRLKLKIENIPKVISVKFFNIYYPKFVPIMYEYFGNLFNWVNEVYPNIFTCRDFGYIECIDGTIVKSHPEQIIHNYLITKYENVKYILNNKNNLGTYDDKDYFPDWIINDQYVLEYLGYYRKNIENTKDKRLIKYNEKARDKMDIANESNKYEFIFIFDQDLLQNLKVLKDKLFIINNKIA